MGDRVWLYLAGCVENAIAGLIYTDVADTFFPFEKICLIYCGYKANTWGACTLVYCVVGFVCIHTLGLGDGNVPRTLVTPLHLPHNIFG